MLHTINTLRGRRRPSLPSGCSIRRSLLTCRWLCGLLVHPGRHPHGHSEIRFRFLRPDKINNPNETPIINMEANNNYEDDHDGGGDGANGDNMGPSSDVDAAAVGKMDKPEPRPCINECDNTLGRESMTGPKDGGWSSGIPVGIRVPRQRRMSMAAFDVVKQ